MSYNSTIEKYDHSIENDQNKIIAQNLEFEELEVSYDSILEKCNCDKGYDSSIEINGQLAKDEKLIDEILINDLTQEFKLEG